MKAPVFKADVPEGDSPKALATDPGTTPPKEEELPEPAVAAKKQEEDADSDSKEREGDIYADAVLACKSTTYFPSRALTNST